MKISKSIKGSLLIVDQNNIIEHIVFGTPFISAHPKDEDIIVLDHTTEQVYANVRIYVPDVSEAFGSAFVGNRSDLMELISNNFSREGGSSSTTTTMTGSDVKTLYESETDTNAFTDIEKQKLTGIEAGATTDMTGSEIKALYEAEADTNALTDNLKSLLESNKVLNITTDAVNNRLVVDYTDGTQIKLSLADVINDIRVTEAKLDATTNNLILTDSDGTEINVDLSAYVLHSEVQDNTTSQSTTLPLSANQGRVLQEQITENKEGIDTIKTSVTNNTSAVSKEATDRAGADTNLQEQITENSNNIITQQARSRHMIYKVATIDTNMYVNEQVLAQAYFGQISGSAAIALGGSGLQGIYELDEQGGVVQLSDTFDGLQIQNNNDDGAYKWNNSTSAFESLPVSTTYLTEVQELGKDNSFRYWIGTTGNSWQINRYEIGNNMTKTIANQDNNPNITALEQAQNQYNTLNYS